MEKKNKKNKKINQTKPNQKPTHRTKPLRTSTGKVKILKSKFSCGILKILLW